MVAKDAQTYTTRSADGSGARGQVGGVHVVDGTSVSVLAAINERIELPDGVILTPREQAIFGVLQATSSSRHVVTLAELARSETISPLIANIKSDNGKEGAVKRSIACLTGKLDPEGLTVTLADELSEYDRRGYYLRRVNPRRKVEAEVVTVGERKSKWVESEAKFGPFSEADIVVIAGALESNRSLIEKILEQKGLRLPVEEFLARLSNISGDKPLPGLHPDDVKDPRAVKAFIVEGRTIAFSKAQQFTHGYDFESDPKGIKRENVSVFALLKQLHKIDQTVKGRISNESSESSGVELLTKLVANDESQRTGVFIEGTDGRMFHIYVETISGKLPKIITREILPNKLPDTEDQVVGGSSTRRAVEVEATVATAEVSKTERRGQLASDERILTADIRGSLDTLITALMKDFRGGATEERLRQAFVVDLGEFNFGIAEARGVIDGPNRDGLYSIISIAVALYVSSLRQTGRGLTASQMAELNDLAKSVYEEQAAA